MAVNLINGDGVNAVYASQDADWYAAITGQKTTILNVNQNLGYELMDNNHLVIKSGLLVTKEGRRVQINVGDTEEIVIPTGTQHVNRYYICGFKLETDEHGVQSASSFIEQMSSSAETIEEEAFKDGATTVYVSLYRIYQNGITIQSITPLLNTVGIPSSRAYPMGDLIDIIHPVGKIFFTDDPRNPAEYYPGTTWVAWGSGRVPVGVDSSDSDFNAPDKTGGSKTVKPTINSTTITTSNMATMNAGSTTTISGNFSAIVDAFEYLRMLWNSNKAAGKVTGEVVVPNPSTTYPTTSLAKAYNASHLHTANDASILQSYVTCYMWKRTS